MNNRIGKTAGLVALLAASLSMCASYGAGVVGVNPTNTITATMDSGILRTANTWYELGVNTASNTTGLATGLIAGQTDPLSTYLIQSASGLNVMMLDTNRRSGTLTFTRPVSVTGLSLAGASGNGTGTNTLTLRFTDGSTDTLSPLVVGDWFGNDPRVETAHGRIDVGANSFANVGEDNPRLLAINATLPTADQSKDIFAIDFSWIGSANNTHTAIFGVSGDFTSLGHYSAIPLDSGSFNQDVIVGLAEVPEPGTIALFGLGAAGLLAVARRRRV